MLKLTVVLCAFFGVSFASLMLAPLDPKPDKFKTSEGCYIKEQDIMLKLGDSIPSIVKCARLTCGEKYVTIAGCGVIQNTDPGCSLVADDSIPYPGCCPMVLCE